uniref:Uncharacterized protein n=1 Tax=Caenorhabditis japonica TaxID=281687 RepID=A0A8R1HZS3_CAEJA
MSSITRAVTSRLSELTNGRQRLTSEKQSVSSSTSQFNYIIPPEIIWEEYQASKQVQEPLKVDVEPEPEPKAEIEIAEKKTSPSIFSQKMSAVVRKLSPFSDDSLSSSKEKDSSGSGGVVDEEKKKNGGRFKETKQKMEKFKKFRRSKDRQQLIESSDDEA